MLREVVCFVKFCHIYTIMILELDVIPFTEVNDWPSTTLKKNRYDILHADNYLSVARKCMLITDTLGDCTFILRSLYWHRTRTIVRCPQEYTFQFHIYCVLIVNKLGE